MKVIDADWNLGNGLNNVCNAVMRKLQYAGFQLESKERTIINMDSYETTVLIWALKEFMKKKEAKWN